MLERIRKAKPQVRHEHSSSRPSLPAILRTLPTGHRVRQAANTITN